MAGISVRHGSQLVAQKLTHTRRSPASARDQDLPSRSTTLNGGAGCPTNEPMRPSGAPRSNGTAASTASTTASAPMASSQSRL
jgi:hypothetical protein